MTDELCVSRQLTLSLGMWPGLRDVADSTCLLQQALKHLNMVAENKATTMPAGPTGDSGLQISGGHPKFPS